MKILAFLTFPGVMLRESIRLVVCRASGAAVFRLRIFPGPLAHERPGPASTLTLIPMAIALPLATALMIPAALAAMMGSLGWIEIFFVWLGISLGGQCSPAAEDAIASKLTGIYYLGPFVGVLLPAGLAWGLALLI